MPQKGGFIKNVKRAVGIGCQSLQVFVGNPTGWTPPKLDPAELRKRGEQVQEEGIRPLIVHAAYLINLAAIKEEFHQKSIHLLLETAYRAEYLQARYVVMHVGSHGGRGFTPGIDFFIKTLDQVLHRWPEQVELLLENTAGGGTSLGGTFISIGNILNKLEAKTSVGVCLDTAHAWAAGYDWTTEEGFQKTMEEIEQYIGMEKVKTIHANDSGTPRGSHRDRHAHIGDGYIGDHGFRQFFRWKWPQDLPVILETPEMGSHWDAINLGRLRYFSGLISEPPETPEK